MFYPTQSHDEHLKEYPAEPTIRIGRNVPKNAVNMAYYFNPTATDAEKVLCAEAPRKTIDHRVEELFRYLFDCPDANDDLFPQTVTFDDDEGYTAPLPRIWVKWKEKQHIYTKHGRHIETYMMDSKNDVPGTYYYSDSDGFSGNLFLDVDPQYEVRTWRREEVSTKAKMEVKDCELKKEVPESSLDAYMVPPTVSGSPWPKELWVRRKTGTTQYYLYDSSGKNWGECYFADYQTEEDNPLVFTSLEKEPVKGTSGTPTFKAQAGYIALYKTGSSGDPFNSQTTFSGDGINNFLSLYDSYRDSGSDSKMAQVLNQWRNGSSTLRQQLSITITRVDHDSVEITSDPDGELVSPVYAYLAGYRMEYIQVGEEGEHNWNVYANYDGIVVKGSVEYRETPSMYECTAIYTGMLRLVEKTYDGQAFYKGSVVKEDGIGSVNPELTADLIMYPDDEGYLRRIRRDNDDKYDYTIDAEQFYITDVFKDNVPCFYKYTLKNPIHDYRGPDENGYYAGNAVKVYTNNYKELPSKYAYQLKLSPNEYEDEEETIVKNYSVELYTSFVSKTTDTYKASYNAYVDFDTQSITNSNNGINEEIYNKPFMYRGVDFGIEPVDARVRSNKIKLFRPNIIEDTRRYIEFNYKVVVYKRPTDGTVEEKIFESSLRMGRILNKEYAVESEYDKFIGRSMIVSPIENGIYLSPYDIVIRDQATLTDEQPITIKDSNRKEFIFYTVIDENTLNNQYIGAINMTCNTDGTGYVLAETTLDTGFEVTRVNEETGEIEPLNVFTKKLIVNNPYIVENNKIYPGYAVRCLDVRNVSIKPPREDNLLESWYPLIQFGHYSQVMDQYGVHTKIAYTMPEYDKQLFNSTYGKPYVDVVKEKAEIINPHLIKVRCIPLFTRDYEDNIKVYKKVGDELLELTIYDISFEEGIIILKENISENDTILVDYIYLEQYYVYRGYYISEDDYARIDLNPNMYHTYSDLDFTPTEIQPTTNLFNKTIYFYMRPSVELGAGTDNTDDETTYNKVVLQNDITLYHTIDNYEPESEEDIYIGSVYIRQNTSLHSTILIDTRTRGGGVIEEMKDSLRRELEPESDYYFDIGYYDGKPYQENAVIIVRLDNSILKEYGGRFTKYDVEQKVKKWIGYGVYPIIEYVDSYNKFSMPQYNLVVEDSFINIIDYIPEFSVECEEF